jgi:hypothetical protein
MRSYGGTVKMDLAGNVLKAWPKKKTLTCFVNISFNLPSRRRKSGTG